MDADTERLILQLQMQDLRDLGAAIRAKSADGSARSDEDVAVIHQWNEFYKRRTAMLDTRMARSISGAVCDDAAAIAVHLTEERRAVDDRGHAHRMDGRPPPTIPATPTVPALDERSFTRFSNYNAARDIAPVVRENEASTESPSYTPREGNKRSRQFDRRDLHQCTACSALQYTVQVPCKDHYCAPCLIQLVRNAVRDETIFPPRCCRQEMSLSAIRTFIGPELTATFEQKTIEFGTPVRTYCYFCSKFIVPGRHPR